MGGRKTPGGNSLYDKSPKTWDDLGARGFHGIVKMSKLFSVASFMDHQLGTTNAVSKWHRGVSVPRWNWEREALRWLEAHPEATLDMHEIERRKKGRDQYVPSVEDEDEDTPTTAGAVPKVFVFVCDEAVAPKLLKIARMLNCAVEEL